jgi:hypothetical protein
VQALGGLQELVLLLVLLLLLLLLLVYEVQGQLLCLPV